MLTADKTMGRGAGTRHQMAIYTTFFHKKPLLRRVAAVTAFFFALFSIPFNTTATVRSQSKSSVPVIAPPPVAPLSEHRTWKSAQQLMRQMATQRQSAQSAWYDASDWHRNRRELGAHLTRLHQQLGNRQATTEDVWALQHTTQQFHGARQRLEQALEQAEQKLAHLGFTDRIPRLRAFRVQLTEHAGTLDAAVASFAAKPDAVQANTIANLASQLGMSHRTAAPVAEDLGESIEVQLTPEIMAQAAALDHSAVRIYEFVRNDIGFELYDGSRKGALATLQTRRGNDVDQASLLIALLRAAGIPARYVRGIVLVPAERIRDWLGLQDAAAANPILNTAGITSQPLTNNAGTLTSYLMTRMWVAAHVSFSNYRGATDHIAAPLWVSLDPAFTRGAPQPGIAGVSAAVDFDEATYFSQVQAQMPHDIYRAQVQDFLNRSNPGTSVADLPYRNALVPQRFGLLPASLPYNVAQVLSQFSTVPDNLRHQVRLRLSASGLLLDVTWRVPQVALQRRTISYVPATLADQAIVDGFGGLANTPPMAVDVRPQLKLDGILALEGNPVSLGTRVQLAVDFIRSEQGVVATGNHTALRAGQHISVNLDAGQISDALLIERASRLLAAQEFVGTPSEDADALTGELLNIAGMLYWKRLRDGENAIAEIFQRLIVRDLSESTTRADLEALLLLDRPFALTPGNLSLDAIRINRSTFGIDNDESDGPTFRRLIGLESSAQEHAMWEELVGLEAIPTVKAFQVASTQGIPLRTITSANVAEPVICADGNQRSVFECMAACDTFSIVIQGINAFINAGREVLAQECPILLNQWIGVGWAAFDTSSQVGAFLITGGLFTPQQSSGATTIADGSPIRAIHAETAATMTYGLPAHTINARNIDAVLAVLPLPQALRAHIRDLVGRGATIVLWDVVLEIDGQAGLVFQVERADDGSRQSFVYTGDAGGTVTCGVQNGAFVGGDLQIDIEFLSNLGQPPEVVLIGDPVNVVNGNFFRQERDFFIPAIGFPLAFSRFYNSQLLSDIGLGTGWTHSYSDQLITQPDAAVTWVDRQGAMFRFRPDGSGGFITPPTLGVSRDQLQQTPTGFELRSKRGIVRTFNAAGQLTARRDRNDNTQTLAYDANGQLQSITDTANRSLTFTYDETGHIATVTDFTGRTWTYQYDAGNLTRVESPSDAQTLPLVTQYKYISGPINANRLQQIIEPNGGGRHLAYYTNGRVLQITGPEGGTATLIYDLFTQQTHYLDERDFRTIYHYDDAGLTTAIEYADGSIERWNWDTQRITSYTDALGHTATFDYDSEGNFIRHVSRSGIATQYDYEPPFASITRRVRSGGRETGFRYDANGNLAEIRNTLGSAVTLGVNAQGLTDRVIDAAGQTLTRDNAGLVTSETSEWPSTTRLFYHPRGTIRERQDATGNATQFEYNLLDRLISTTNAEGHTARFVYDAGGRLVQ